MGKETLLRKKVRMYVAKAKQSDEETDVITLRKEEGGLLKIIGIILYIFAATIALIGLFIGSLKMLSLGVILWMTIALIITLTEDSDEENEGETSIGLSPENGLKAFVKKEKGLRIHDNVDVVIELRSVKE